VVSITEVQRQLAHVLPPGTPLEPLASVGTNTAAARVITEAGRTIGRALADLCNCLNPAAIILGGELGTAGQPLITGVRESVDRYSQPATAAAVKIHTAQLGIRAELMGTIATAIQQLEPAPGRTPRTF
jgi:predicted NBD/HSP70 family sugar kinase